MTDIDAVKADREAQSGSEVVVKYGIGVVAFEERFNGYVLRYEAENVPQLLELIEQLQTKWAREKAAKKSGVIT